MIAASILVLAAVLWIRLRRIAIVIGAFGRTIEKALNRAYEQRGEPPLFTTDDIEDIEKIL